jgi:hypothetical protein
MRLRVFIPALTLLLAARVFADKIIMKDGKIYQGHIMGETQHSVLISNPPIDPKPRFIDIKDVLTIVRESRPAEKPSAEEGRFASASFGITGQAYSSDTLSFSPAPGFYIGGGFRVHPSLELGGEFDYVPSLSGVDLTVTDGTNTRDYESFYAYHGGFSAKVFPFFRRRDWRMEPYLTTGYHWNRLIPKGSGDELKGTSFFGGAGVMIPWWKPMYWDLRFVYEHTNYDSIKFLTGEGDLSGVSHDSYTLSTGLSYRFL